MKRFIMLALLIAFGSAAFAQKAQVTSAWNYLKNNELDNARKAIDAATQDATTGTMAKTWAYRGKIYLATSVDTVENKLVPKALDEAQLSFIKAAELDTKKEFQEDIVNGLQAIAFQKFNEGVQPYNAQQYEPAYGAFKDVSDIYAFLNTQYNIGIVDTSAMYYGAFAAAKIKKYDEATANYNKLIELNYKKPEVYQGLSNIALAQKDTAAALKYIEQGRAMNPDNNLLMFDELNILLAQNKTNAVIAKLEEAIAKSPKSAAELNYVLGNKYDLALLDTTNAMKYYGEALRLKPDYFDVNYSAGAMFFNQAVVINDRMNKLPLSDQKQYDELKIVRDRLFRRALPYMEKAYELNPRDRDTLVALKELYARLNMTDKQNKVGEELKALEGK